MGGKHVHASLNHTHGAAPAYQRRRPITDTLIIALPIAVSVFVVHCYTYTSPYWPVSAMEIMQGHLSRRPAFNMCRP